MSHRDKEQRFYSPLRSAMSSQRLSFDMENPEFLPRLCRFPAWSRQRNRIDSVRCNHNSIERYFLKDTE